MTVDTAPRSALPLSVAPSSAPATGLFGGGKPASPEASPAALLASEPVSTQRKSFSDLFRAELHAA